MAGYGPASCACPSPTHRTPPTPTRPHLRALPAVGGAPAPRLGAEALARVGDAERPVDKGLNLGHLPSLWLPLLAPWPAACRHDETPCRTAPCCCCRRWT